MRGRFSGFPRVDLFLLRVYHLHIHTPCAHALVLATIPLMQWGPFRRCCFRGQPSCDPQDHPPLHREEEKRQSPVCARWYACAFLYVSPPPVRTKTAQYSRCGRGFTFSLYVSLPAVFEGSQAIIHKTINGKVQSVRDDMRALFSISPCGAWHILGVTNPALHPSTCFWCGAQVACAKTPAYKVFSQSTSPY